VVEGSVPPIPPEDYLIPQRPKGAVRVKTFKDHVTSNIHHSWFSDYLCAAAGGDIRPGSSRVHMWSYSAIGKSSGNWPWSLGPAL